MIDDALINLVVSEIGSVSESDFSAYIDSVVNILADKLGFPLVEIYLLDHTNEWAILRAGSGKIGEFFVNRNRKFTLVGKDEFDSQISSAILSAEIRVRRWVSGEVLSWPLHRGSSLPETNLIFTTRQHKISPFSSPEIPLVMTELYVPVQVKTIVKGVLVIHSRDPFAFNAADVEKILTVCKKIEERLT